MKTDLLIILSDFINNRASTNFRLSQEEIQLAQAHQVLPIVYYQTKDEAAKSAFLQAISTYTQRKTLFLQITKALGDIPYFVVKGMSVSDYYPIPQLRTMGDCDIVVHKTDKDKAKQAFLLLNFTDNTSEWDCSAEWHFLRQGLDFELHHRLLYDEVVNTEKEKAFADSSWNYVQDRKLNVNFHFVFLLLHLKKHLLNRGVGFRQFMDLSLLSKNANLEREQIDYFLQQAGIEKFAGVCSALCHRWFGITLPVDTPEITEEFYNHATDIVLANGVFGFELSSNEEKRLLNSIKKKGKASLIMGRIFPSYKICCLTPKYKWVKNKPYLLPVLWIYRILEAVFSGKGRSSLEYMTAVTKSDKAMAERDKELAMWGL